MLLQDFILFLTISLSSCLPQLNEEPYSYWRNRPRSISSTSYYSNHPATYQNPQEIKRYDSQPEYGSYDNRPKGPTAGTDEVKEVRIMNYPSERGSVGGTMYNDQNSDFVFPGYDINSTTTTPPKKPVSKPIITTRSNLYVPDMSTILKNCPLTSTFCESVDYYPTDYIHNKLEENAETYRGFFGSDELVSVDIDINTRIGVAEGDGTPMCAASERVIQPSVAINMEKEWKYIVNDDKYVQGIRVEICQKAGSKCAMSDNFPLSYETECKQKFIFRKLLSLASSGEVHTDNFRMPSCCVCVYRPKRIGRSAFGLK